MTNDKTTLIINIGIAIAIFSILKKLGFIDLGLSKEEKSAEDLGNSIKKDGIVFNVWDGYSAADTIYKKMKADNGGKIPSYAERFGINTTSIDVVRSYYLKTAENVYKATVSGDITDLLTGSQWFTDDEEYAVAELKTRGATNLRFAYLCGIFNEKYKLNLLAFLKSDFLETEHLAQLQKHILNSKLY